MKGCETEPLTVRAVSYFECSAFRSFRQPRRSDSECTHGTLGGIARIRRYVQMPTEVLVPLQRETATVGAIVRAHDVGSQAAQGRQSSEIFQDCFMGT
jgi:hypothetical protein